VKEGNGVVNDSLKFAEWTS